MVNSSRQLAVKLAKHAYTLAGDEQDTFIEFRTMRQYIGEALQDRRNNIEKASVEELTNIVGDDWEAVHEASRWVKKSYPRSRQRERTLDLLLYVLLLQVRRGNERGDQQR